MTGNGQRISDETARAIWHRAAQLQAAAERRMEDRARRLEAGDGGRSHDLVVDGHRPDDVEAAAVEAGISPEFVRIAMAELSAAGSNSAPLPPLELRGARIVLGSLQRAVELTTLVAGSLDLVTTAVLRVFPASPCMLHPQQIVALPSDAGRLVIFKVPKYDWSASANPPFAEKAYMIGLQQLHVTIRPIAAAPAPPICEVLVTGDLQPGMRTRWRFGAATSAATGIAGGGLGVSLAVAAAIPGFLLALPAVAGVAVIGGFTAGLWGLTYRLYRRQLESSLEESLSLLARTDPTAFMFGQPGQPGHPAGGDSPPRGVHLPP